MKNFYRTTSVILATIWVLGFSGVALSQTRVKTQTLEQVNISLIQSAPAEVVSLQQATIASQLAAIINSIPVKVGDRVSENQILGMLDCTDSELALQQSNADLEALIASRELAVKQLARLNQLSKSNNASEETINQREAELRSVTARIKSQKIGINIAQRQVDKCQLTAPYAGVITDIHLEEGNFATAGSNIISLTNTENIELQARISYSELEEIVASSEIRFQFQDSSYDVKIRSIVDVIDPTSQTQIMRLVFSNESPLAGSVGRLQWKIQGMIVPSALIVNRNQQRGIFIVHKNGDANTAKFIAVDESNPGQPAFVDLGKHTQIITEGRFSLKDGDKVIID